MSRNVIVIGGVALGPKAASRLKRLDPTANVTMIDENINISFGGCGIPYYVSGEINSLDALRSTTYGTVRTPEYFEHKGVHTLNQTRVTAIDRAAKTVTAKNLVTGEEKALPYDRLIIATGSTPKVPPVEGRDLKNVGGANNLEDADIAEGQRIGVQGTPYFLINNLVARGALSSDLFKEAINMAVQAAPSGQK